MAAGRVLVASEGGSNPGSESAVTFGTVNIASGDHMSGPFVHQIDPVLFDIWALPSGSWRFISSSDAVMDGSTSRSGRSGA